MKHLEFSAPSLAECYKKIKESDLLLLSDLCLPAKVTIDIYNNKKNEEEKK